MTKPALPSLRPNEKAIQEAIVPFTEDEQAQITEDAARHQFWQQIRTQLNAQANLAATSVLPANYLPDDLAKMQATWQQRVAQNKQIARQKYEGAVAALMDDGVQPSTTRAAFKLVHERVRALCQPLAYPPTVKILTKTKKIDCRRCKDAGVLRIEGPDPTKPAETKTCPYCAGLRKQRNLVKKLERERNAINSSWPERPELMALGGTRFVPGYAQMLRLPTEAQRKITAKLKHALNVTERYIAVWPNEAWLQYDGVCGAGKTHFLAMIYKAAQLGGKTTVYVTAPEIESVLLNFSGENANEKIETYIRQLIAAEVLLIDEAEKFSQKDGKGYVERKIFHILDTRSKMAKANLGNFHTILAGNALKKSLPPEIKSRAGGAGSYYVDLFGVPDGRSIFDGNPAWKKGLGG